MKNNGSQQNIEDRPSIMAAGDLLDFSPAEIAIDQGSFPWQMTRVERLGLRHLLQTIKPRLALEIGTDKGGSLEAILQYAERAISIDINAQNQSLLQQKPEFNNAEFITGNSAEILPTLIDFINKSDVHANFILIDGDHSTQGCQNDIELILEIIPKSLTCIVMHDSFMPSCRTAMGNVNWSRCEYVHYVEFDYVQGAFIGSLDNGGFKMVGGLAVVLLKPVKRIGNLPIYQSHRDSYEKLRALVG